MDVDNIPRISHPPDLPLMCATCSVITPRVSSETNLCPLCEKKVGNALAANKPRKQRMTKRCLEGEFRTWVSQWSSAYRVRKSRGLGMPSRAVSPPPSPRAPGPEDRTDHWRVDDIRRKGGTVYATADAFFDAVRGSVEGVASAREAGDGTVLQFCGRYSIVAQPRIDALGRLRRVAARMRELGLK